MPKPRVLLAHDDADCRKIYGSMLEIAGYDVVMSDHGDRALGLLSSAAFDILITDLYLRSVEDECLLRRVRRRGGWSHLPVVVLTGWTTDPHRTLARDEGADVYLPLPVGPRQLLAAVNRLLAGGSTRAPISPGTASREDPRDHPILPGVLGL